MSNYFIGYTATQLDEAIEKVQNGYRDVSGVTSTENDVKVGTTFIDSSGELKGCTLNPDTYYDSGYSAGHDVGYESGHTEGQEVGYSKCLDEITSNPISIGVPVISVDSAGLITVTLTQDTGYVNGDTITTTYQLSTHSGGKFTGDDQTISVSGKFMLGDIVIETPEPTYTVTAISGATYGFELNSAGYYESNNKGVQNSYAICRVNFNIATETTVYFDCINYAESNYDYGLLSNLDTSLALSNSVDSSVAKNFKGLSNSSVQIVTYTIPAGTHFVDVKFRKDGSGDNYNDSLQFNVRFA